MGRYTSKLWIVVTIVLFILFTMNMTHRRIDGFSNELVRIDSFTQRMDTSAPTEVSGVPLVVYRSWSSNNIPVRMMETVKKTMVMTPEFDNYFF